jgi:hypothetical protein
MSQDYEIGIVSVSTLVPVQKVLSETVQLADVMGYLPVQELREVLSSAWARGDGWQVVREGAIYRRSLARGVELQLEVSAEGTVSLRRSTAAQSVAEAMAAQTEQEQAKLLASVEESYNRAVGELIGRALAQALPRLAAEQGFEVIDRRELIRNNAMVGVELVLHVEANRNVQD